MPFMKTILNGLKVWAENLFISHKPQTLSSSQKQQARENIGLIEETSDDALEMLTEMGVIETATNEEGFVLTDENGNILTI
jgi:hypothetical protein